MDRESLGEEAARRLKRLAECSEPGPGVTRLPFTREHRAANDLIADWMEAAGLSVTLDAAGTLIGRREAPGGGPALLFGSHQDSIRQGGRFDGAMGVVLPILALETMERRDLPVSVEVLAFADEEGVRFPTALMGPRALAGTFRPGDLALSDGEGTTLATALTAFTGGEGDLSGLRRRPEDVLGYVEAHIEQGPVLEAEGRALGVVTGICGIERWSVRLTGAAAHAGTTPMTMRRDALTCAAEIALAVEAICRDTEGLVGVVGAFDIAPNVVNAVPGEARLTIELRAAEDAIRGAGAARLERRVADIAASRGIGLALDRTYAQAGVMCDAALSRRLADSVAADGGDVMRLMSGATHDASAMADLCPVAMLFVRCRGGVSHHPDEMVEPADLGAAAIALTTFLETLGVRAR